MKTKELTKKSIRKILEDSEENKEIVFQLNDTVMVQVEGGDKQRLIEYSPLDQRIIQTVYNFIENMYKLDTSTSSTRIFTDAGTRIVVSSVEGKASVICVKKYRRKGL